ncbi:hypothetical protein GQ53DRAFT_473934 [Thozetella sp. PMI_491]|nr:hypothetical protein GQ53DRAFT_473934 [Thozetella sp. PMI_491]
MRAGRTHVSPSERLWLPAGLGWVNNLSIPLSPLATGKIKQQECGLSHSRLEFRIELRGGHWRKYSVRDITARCKVILTAGLTSSHLYLSLRAGPPPCSTAGSFTGGACARLHAHMASVFGIPSLAWVTRVTALHIAAKRGPGSTELRLLETITRGVRPCSCSCQPDKRPLPAVQRSSPCNDEPGSLGCKPCLFPLSRRCAILPCTLHHVCNLQNSTS